MATWRKIDLGRAIIIITNILFLPETAISKCVPFRVEKQNNEAVFLFPARPHSFAFTYCLDAPGLVICTMLLDPGAQSQRRRRGSPKPGYFKKPRGACVRPGGLLPLAPRPCRGAEAVDIRAIWVLASCVQSLMGPCLPVCSQARCRIQGPRCSLLEEIYQAPDLSFVFFFVLFCGRLVTLTHILRSTIRRIVSLSQTKSDW